MEEKKVYKVPENDSERIVALEAELAKTKAELESQIDGTSRLVQDCDAWREKYRELKAKYDDLEAKYHTIEASNCYMETELYRVKATRDELSKKCSEALADNKRMHNQSLLDRIFNR